MKLYEDGIASWYSGVAVVVGGCVLKGCSHQLSPLVGLQIFTSPDLVRRLGMISCKERESKH